MTLAPVFRSPEAVSALQSRGYWRELEGSIAAYRNASEIIKNHLEEVIDSRFLKPSSSPTHDMLFLQENFFLILFHSIFRTIECKPDHLHLYALLNYCIRGLVLSGDNLFDEEDKLVLPLSLGQGKRFMSIVQMMCFQNLIQQVLKEEGRWLEEEEKCRFQRNLLSTLTEIGGLEGSEEGGVDHVPEVQGMIESVHRVRGGTLFSLAFVAPRIVERGKNRSAWETAEEGIRDLGTAFQIVDDLTDLEFDLRRGSHNLVVAQVMHHGDKKEKNLMIKLRQSPEMCAEGNWIEKGFQEAAAAVLELAKIEAEKGFKTLKNIGFWFPSEDALLFVRAIAGDAGFKRVQGLPTH